MSVQCFNGTTNHNIDRIVWLYFPCFVSPFFYTDLLISIRLKHEYVHDWNMMNFMKIVIQTKYKKTTFKKYVMALSFLLKQQEHYRQ